MMRMEEDFDSLRDAGAARAAASLPPFASFFSASAGAASFGAPSGNADLNLPVTRAAIVLLPDATICFETSSGCANWSADAAMSPDLADVSISGANVRAVPGFRETLPASMKSAVPSWAVGSAFALKFSWVRLIHTG